MTLSNKNLIEAKHDLHKGFNQHLNKGFNKKDLNQAIKMTYEWIMSNLHKIDVTETEHSKIIKVFDTFCYEINNQDKVYQVTVDQSLQESNKTKYINAYLTKVLSNAQWLKFIVPKALTPKLYQKFKLNHQIHDAFYCFMFRAISKQHEFQTLKHINLPALITISQKHLDIIDSLSIDIKHLDCVDLTMIWRHEDTLFHLLKENNALLKTYVLFLRSYYANASLQQNKVGERAGEAPGLLQSTYLFKQFKQEVVDKVGNSGWKYALQFGDGMFTYIRQRANSKSNDGMKQMILDYLQFLQNCHYPIPPNAKILRALFNQHAEKAQNRHQATIWHTPDMTNYDTYAIAFNYLGNKRLLQTSDIDDLYTVIKWTSKQQTILDNNQIKQGFNYLLKQANASKEMTRAMLYEKNTLWKSLAEPFQIGRYQCEEVSSYADLFQLGQTMRNCLDQQYEHYDPDNVRVFTLSVSQAKRPIALFSYVLEDGIEEAEGYANATLPKPILEVVKEARKHIKREMQIYHPKHLFSLKNLDLFA